MVSKLDACVSIYAAEDRKKITRFKNLTKKTKGNMYSQKENNCLLNMDDQLWFAEKTQGRWMLEIRRSLGYTQKEFAQILGYKIPEISRFENNVRPIPKNTRVAIMLMLICYEKGDLTVKRLVTAPRVHNSLVQAVRSKIMSKLE